MTSEYSVLETSHVSAGQTVHTPVFLSLLAHIDDPAIDVMLDYQMTAPIIVDAEQPMFKTRQLLEKTGMPLALVHDNHQNLLGALSLQHILSEKTIKLIEENRVLRREVLTKNVMTAIADIPLLDFAQLKLAKVGHIVTTLEKLKQPYILVVESLTPNAPLTIGGAFIESNIAKMLGKASMSHTTTEATVSYL